jgi:hypothetical protein
VSYENLSTNRTITLYFFTFVDVYAYLNCTQKYVSQDDFIFYLLGQLAINLAKDNEMREVLSVRPVQRLQRTAARFEGPLLKRSRFLGWRPVWVSTFQKAIKRFRTRYSQYF